MTQKTKFKWKKQQQTNKQILAFVIPKTINYFQMQKANGSPMLNN